MKTKTDKALEDAVGSMVNELELMYAPGKIKGMVCRFHSDGEPGLQKMVTKYVKNKGLNLGLDQFGESAPYKEVYKL